MPESCWAFQFEFVHIAENLLDSQLLFSSRPSRRSWCVVRNTFGYVGPCMCVCVRYNRAYIKYLYGVRAQRLFVSLEIQGLCIRLELAPVVRVISKRPFSGFSGFGKSCESTGKQGTLSLYFEIILTDIRSGVQLQVWFSWLRLGCFESPNQMTSVIGPAKHIFINKIDGTIAQYRLISSSTCARAVVLRFCFERHTHTHTNNRDKQQQNYSATLIRIDGWKTHGFERYSHIKA